MLKFGLLFISCVLFFLSFVSLLVTVVAVKRQDFKTCDQISFCRRNRAYADRALTNSSYVSPYAVTRSSIILKDGVLGGELQNTAGQNFVFQLHLLENNMIRLRINEKNPLKPRYDEVKEHVLIQEPANTLNYTLENADPNSTFTTINFGPGNNKIVLHHLPFRVDLYMNNVPSITLNDRGFFNFEHLRVKDETPKAVDQSDGGSGENEVQDNGDDGDWEETFDGKTDTKPRGPESIALDISFPGFSHVYGIPEHASSLSLKQTRGEDGAYSEPYRLYNLDVFEYEMDSPMALYGSIPFMMAHRKGATAAIFWLNAAETWVDIVKAKDERHGLSKILNLSKTAQTTTRTHWISESGIVDLFVFMGPTASDIFRNYGALTGYTSLPQSFAIAYHQCRWNYINQDDVAEVEQGFDQNDIPADVIWLDIEHTDGKRYFTWDYSKFPNPEKMQNDLAAKGRKLVTIVDPHIKRDDQFYIYKESRDLNLLIKDNNGNDFEGWCWPGSSSWIDYNDPNAQEWWRNQFAFDKYKGSTENLFVWNDMNEPSIFSGPEITLPKDSIHYNGWEHRNLHNVFGMFLHAATSQGLITRSKPSKRSFVLSRAFFAGSQRFGAIWTGDNMANWEHLAASSPMLLTIGLSGLSFSGADVGGFFGNPETELLVRWYQTGSFQPFFRAHAHLDTKRREPWLFGEPYTTYIRNTIRERYALLPFWYTVFQSAGVTGMPVMRPMFVIFPNDEETFAIEDQYFIGDSLLVKPIVAEGQISTDIYLSGNEIYYDYWTFEPISGPGKVSIEAPIDKIPVLLRGGSIIPRKQRMRRSSSLMRLDPYTLLIGLNRKGEASGTLYIDDGETFDYETGGYVHRHFQYSNNTLTSTSLEIKGDNTKFVDSITRVRFERVIIVGLGQEPSKVVVYYNNTKDKKQELTFVWGKKNVVGTGISCQNSNEKVLVIKDPSVLVWRDWNLEISF